MQSKIPAANPPLSGISGLNILRAAILAAQTAVPRGQLRHPAEAVALRAQRRCRVKRGSNQPVRFSAESGVKVRLGVAPAQTARAARLHRRKPPVKLQAEFAAGATVFPAFINARSGGDQMITPNEPPCAHLRPMVDSLERKPGSKTADEAAEKQADTGSNLTDHINRSHDGTLSVRV